MSQTELQRIKVIENAVAGRITVREAAEHLRLSERQVKRLKGAHDESAENWVYHGNRGRQPVNALSSETRQQVHSASFQVEHENSVGYLRTLRHANGCR